jgi:hypothetical protein
MEEERKRTGQNLGIAALIIAIVTFVLAVIPCVGLIAIIPGILAIVLASVGLSQTAGSDLPRGTLVAGLIIAIIAVMISLSQVLVVGKIAKNADKWPNEIQNIVKDVQENVVKELEDNNISIKVESNGDKVEISTSSDKKDLEKKLEDLEGGKSIKNDTVKAKEETTTNITVRTRK